jgi:SAM-dependent methyltransferase
VLFNSYPVTAFLQSVISPIRSIAPEQPCAQYLRLPSELCCIHHGLPLMEATGAAQVTHSSRSLTCRAGCRVPVIRGIPRFVASEGYAAGFGRQWKRFRRTQLDSFTWTTISRDRLSRCLGGSLAELRGKTVLEVGCGAGRFTELLLAAGARVFAADLSNAVEANYDNCCGAADYFVCQADLRALPAHRDSFDFVICLGVIQHTPEPEATIATLSEFVRPGGRLVIDHYRYDSADMTEVRQRLRSLLIRRDPRLALLFVRLLVAVLWPVHRLLWRLSANQWFAKARRLWLRYSPVLDYHDYYSYLGPRLLYAWATLDTHDCLTDFYKHKRTVEQVASCLQRLGLDSIEASYGGNGVEARATRPMSVGGE